MNPWLETIGVILVAVSGGIVGWLFSTSRKSRWIWGYLLPLLLIAILALARCGNALCFIPPFSWIAAGRVKFVVLSVAVTMGLMAPMSRLPYKCEKILLSVLMVAVVVWFSILPFLVPALIKDNLANLETVIGSDGVCFQTKNYTCGPAAAVTALRQLGLPAQEGEIAVLSHTSPVTGTLPQCLYSALKNRYSADGLECQYRSFDSIKQLKQAGLTLVVVKDAFLRDHCVAVLAVTDTMVLMADPVTGRNVMPPEKFEKIWRFSGIVLKRDTVQSI